MNKPELSIVVPMHNEKQCIGEFYRRVTETMDNFDAMYELILVNDGSTDNTGELIRDICTKDNRVTGLFLSRNRGQCTAIYAGIQNSIGKYVIVMDGDLQHKPEEIPLLVEKIRKGYDFVSGTRKNRSESFWLRRLPSKIANYMLRSITKCPIKDMGGFSCINGEIARKLTLRTGHHRLLPALVYIMGGSVSEVPVSAPKRFAGKSHYGIARSVDVLFDIIMLWFQSSFKQRPLYLFGRISLTFFTVTVILFTWVLIDKIFFRVDMGSRPPFFISIITYLSSLIFMSVGFMLEWMSNVLDTVTGRMPYVIREIHNKKNSNENLN